MTTSTKIRGDLAGVLPPSLQRKMTSKRTQILKRMFGGQIAAYTG